MAIAKGIGVISNIKYVGTNLEKNFRKGVINVVGNADWCDVADPLDDTGYDKKDLADAVAAFNRNTDVGLIVTVGGLTTAVPALQHATKPFISLFGGVTTDFPGTITGQFYGGVTLDTLKRNDERVTYLTRPPRNFTPDQICLLTNPDGAITGTEIYAWEHASPGRGGVLKARTEAEILSAFASFKQDKSLSAMVVSADGLFQDKKDALIKAANDSGKYVSYPLQIFANEGGGHHPSHGHHCKQGPKLATAYFSLGQKAATVIRDGRASTLDPAPSEVHDG